MPKKDKYCVYITVIDNTTNVEVLKSQYLHRKSENDKFSVWCQKKNNNDAKVTVSTNKQVLRNIADNNKLFVADTLFKEGDTIT